MIGLKVLGLLGNHMFQFAATYAFSKKLNTNFFILYGTSRMNKPRLEKYFILPHKRRFMNWVYSHLYGNRLLYKKVLNEDIIAEMIPTIHDNMLIEGFFQSADYFEDVKDDIPKIFQLKRKYLKQFSKKYEKTFRENKIVAVHWRRGDYIGQDHDMSLPESYFRNCFKIMPDVSTYKVIFVSDDLEHVKNTFGQKENFIFENNSEIVDLQILIHADILIISNSTFSWWGAYLNPKKDKVIYGPKNWLGFKENKEFPVGVMHRDWNWVDVNNN